jgi:hypothetical protein
VKGETWSLAPHTLQHIGDQVPLCAPEVPQVVEQECGPTRDPPQSVSIDIGLRIENDGGPDAADDMEDVSRGQSVSEIDNSRNTNVAQEQRPRIVVPVHERDYALGHSSEPELKAAAQHADKYQALLGVATCNNGCSQ